MTPTRSRFDTGIEASSAVLPGPPGFWSYSSLSEIETCPRRYALSRAGYPDLWEGRGYPRLPTLPALFGDVVHGALEMIVKALAAGGCESPQSAEAVGVLRQLGGYTAVIGNVTEARLAGLEGNPRLGDGLRHRVERDLRDRAAEARAQVQSYVSSSRLAPGKTPIPGEERVNGGAADRPPTSGRVPLTLGMHAEVRLTAAALRLAGRVDLLSVSEAGAAITDYKTGSEHPSHREQLETYALLWDLDRNANPGRLPVTSLTAAYPGRAIAFPVPDEPGIREIGKKLAARVAEADAELAAPIPRAIPSADNCGNCDVRHLCDEYWASVAPDPAALADRATFDCEGTVGTPNGPHSWWFHREEDADPPMLLQVPRTGPDLTPGRKIRILRLRAAADPEAGATIATMNSTTEIFQRSEGSP